MILHLIIKNQMQAKKRSSSGPEWEGNQIKLHVVFEKEGDKNWPIAVKINVKQNAEKQIYLSEIIWRLKQQSLNDYCNSSVSYYHQTRKIYVFGFILPPEIQHQIFQNQKYKKKIHESAFTLSNNNQFSLKLRFRKKIPTKVELLKEEQKTRYAQNENTEGRQTKQKEKTIQQVVEKVALWRKLYAGFVDQTGEVVHMDLQTSATEIGIVKKTLDDYLLQIRNGKRYGFNFHKQKGAKIGELRSFVKEHKQDDKGKRK